MPDLALGALLRALRSYAVRCQAAAVAAVMLCSCGGRPQLVPLHQLGYLTEHAVVASDAGVRVVVRTDAWPGPPLAELDVLPVELIVENGSPRELHVGSEHVALVTANGRQMDAQQPSASDVPDGVRALMNDRALPERTLAPAERVSGFVYLAAPREADELQLHVDLVEAAQAEPFGRVEVALAFD